MKVITLNLVTCARKACKTSTSSFPLHPRDAELEVVETGMNPQFLANMIRKLEWEAVVIVAKELNLHTLIPETKPEQADLVETTATDESGQAITYKPTKLAEILHRILMETRIKEGKLVCGNCQHEYAVREGIANFLLPAHLV